MRASNLISRTVLALGLVMALACPVLAQNQASRIGPFYFAQNYAYGRVSGGNATIFTGNTTTGTTSITLYSGVVVTPDGRSRNPFQIGATITTYDQNAETVTLTGVSGCGSPTGQGTCTLTGNFTKTHGEGTLLGSGSYGLNEAILDANGQGGGTIEIDNTWAAGAGTSAAAYIAAAPLTESTIIEDRRSYPTQWWSLHYNSQTLVTSPTAGTATTAAGGTFVTGTYRYAETCLTILGGESLISTDSATTIATTTTTAATIVIPALATVPTGCVAVRPYISAASGGAGSEILYAPTATNGICTLSTLETMVAACPPGSAMTIATLVTGTGKVPIQSTAVVTSVPEPSPFPPPAVAVLSFGPFAAITTITTAQYGAETQLPTGFFNNPYETFRICASGQVTAGTGAADTFAINLSPNFAVSPVNLVSWVTGTTTTSGVAVFKGCVDARTVTAGASGTLEVHGPLAIDLTGATPWLNSSYSDNNVAVSSAVDLTKQDVLGVTIACASACTTATVDSLTIEVLPY